MKSMGNAEQIAASQKGRLMLCITNSVPIGEILHVGDDLTTDVGGAIRSGMQFCC